MKHLPDHDIVQACKGQIIPLMVYIYAEAGLEVPLDFNHITEGPRLVAELRAQGYATKIKDPGMVGARVNGRHG